MPLSSHVSVVAGIAQEIRYRDHPVAQIAFVARMAFWFSSASPAIVPSPAGCVSVPDSNIARVGEQLGETW